MSRSSGPTARLEVELGRAPQLQLVEVLRAVFAVHDHERVVPLLAQVERLREPFL